MWRANAALSAGLSLAITLLLAGWINGDLGSYGLSATLRVAFEGVVVFCVVWGVMCVVVTMVRYQWRRGHKSIFCVVGGSFAVVCLSYFKATSWDPCDGASMFCSGQKALLRGFPLPYLQSYYYPGSTPDVKFYFMSLCLDLLVYFVSALTLWLIVQKLRDRMAQQA